MTTCPFDNYTAIRLDGYAWGALLAAFTNKNELDIMKVYSPEKALETSQVISALHYFHIMSIGAHDGVRFLMFMLPDNSLYLDAHKGILYIRL